MHDLLVGDLRTTIVEKDFSHLLRLHPYHLPGSFFDCVAASQSARGYARIMQTLVRYLRSTYAPCTGSRLVCVAAHLTCSPSQGA